MTARFPHWRTVQTIAFDFDGIFTNNTVNVDQYGNESVVCNRSDGLAFDILRRFSTVNDWYPNLFILSKESNPVVTARAKKLGLSCSQSVKDKRQYVSHILESQSHVRHGFIYLCNDLNDLPVMLLPTVFSVAPLDAHPIVLKSANVVVQRKGGDCFVRVFLEEFLGLDLMDLDQLLNFL